MVLDFLSVVLELFTATWDFLKYGKKRISVLHRAYRHGGWQKVRRVSAGRKMAVAVWLVLVMILAAGLASAWTIAAWTVMQAFR